MDPKIGFSPASLKNIINGHFAGKEPWQIVTVTATSVLTGVWLWTLLVQQDSKYLITQLSCTVNIFSAIFSRSIRIPGLYNRSKNYFFRLGRKIPFVKRKIEEELAKIADSFEKDVNNRCEGVPYVVELNEKGMDVKTILQAVDANLGLGEWLVHKNSHSNSQNLCLTDMSVPPVRLVYADKPPPSSV